MFQNNDVCIENMYEFTKKVFKEGCCPKSVEEFKQSLSTETTDGSLCMAYDFGDREKGETTMLFFYPAQCIVPVPYQKYIKEKYINSRGGQDLNLEYIEFAKDNTSNTKYLSFLLAALKDCTNVYTLTTETIMKYNTKVRPTREAIHINANLWFEKAKFQDRARNLANNIKTKIFILEANSQTEQDQLN